MELKPLNENLRPTPEYNTVIQARTKNKIQQSACTKQPCLK